MYSDLGYKIAGSLGRVGKGQVQERLLLAEEGYNHTPTPTLAVQTAPNHSCTGRKPMFIRWLLIREALSFHVVLLFLKTETRGYNCGQDSLRGDAIGTGS